MNNAKLSESKTYFKAEMAYLYISTASMKPVTKDFNFNVMKSNINMMSIHKREITSLLTDWARYFYYLSNIIEILSEVIFRK